jgi:hypothetical protein
MDLSIIPDEMLGALHEAARRALMDDSSQPAWADDLLTEIKRRKLDEA